MILAVVLQVLIPLFLLFYFAVGSTTVMNMITRAVIVIGYILAVRTMAEWLLLPWYGFYLYIGIIAVIALLVVFNRKHVPISPRRRALIRLKIEVVIALVVINLNIFLLLGEAPNSTFIVNLESPVRGHSVYVMNGGANKYMNNHLMSADNPGQIIPGNIYGVDLYVVNSHGRISDMMFPKYSQDYVGYNTMIYAPCEGRVSQVSKDYNDLALGDDSVQILIECAGYEVQLSHLRVNSVEVEEGSYVTTDNHIGNLGAVVDGEAPYLHMHVQRRIEQENGDSEIQPVQVSLINNFLARGDIVP